MGSYCALSFDEIEVLSAKSTVPSDLIAIFQEADRVVRQTPETEDDDAHKDILYQASRATILSRLDLLGFTEAIVRERFSQWRSEQIESWTEYYADFPEEADKETLKALEDFDLHAWRQRAADLLPRQWEQATAEPVDEIERRMRDHYEGWLHFDGHGSLASLRALLDAFPDVKQVTLDITDLVYNGWIDETELICRSRREVDQGEVRNLAPTVILAEGSSDIEIMETSLAVLYPEVKDYFSFFDHHELNVDGGANYLVKFLKAFAAARAPLRIVAVFDNDVAGMQAYKQALSLKLPRNIIVMTLPDIKLAEKYPTVGPQGIGTANVNGRAASIELYLGRASLIDANGDLRSVRWTGYVAPFDAYQGEVEGKTDIRARFLKSIQSVANAEAARETWPELASIWQAIFKITKECTGEARRNGTRKSLE